MSNGNLHDRSNPPALLIGGAHGKLKGDRHIVAKKEPTANLLLSIAHLYGAQIDKFGASTGRLERVSPRPKGEGGAEAPGEG